MWRDTESRVCDPHCDDGVNTCTHDLKCDVSPDVDCSNVPEPAGAEPTEWHACWYIGFLEGTFEAELGPKAMGLCRGCCCPNSDPSACRYREVDACRPLVCDEDDSPPPEPYVCREGHVFNENTE